MHKTVEARIIFAGAYKGEPSRKDSLFYCFSLSVVVILGGQRGMK